MRKSFDVLAEGLISKNSRGDRTPLELFLAGAKGLDAATRAMLGMVIAWTGRSDPRRFLKESLVDLGEIRSCPVDEDDCPGTIRGSERHGRPDARIAAVVTPMASAVPQLGGPAQALLRRRRGLWRQHKPDGIGREDSGVAIGAVIGVRE